jgi:hypothetical protein
VSSFPFVAASRWQQAFAGMPGETCDPEFLSSRAHQYPPYELMTTGANSAKELPRSVLVKRP